MKNKIKKTKGEALLETIIAFVTLAIGVTIAGMIMGSSLRNMQNAKYRIMAVNIAREGIEAMRSIRDTNWLKFHSKRRACWNYRPELNPDAICDGSINSVISPGRYIIYKQGGYPNATDTPTYRWLLTEYEWGGMVNSPNPIPCTSDDLFYHNTSDGFTYKCNNNLKKWVNLGTLSMMDIDNDPTSPEVDTDGDGNYLNDADIYNHYYSYNELNQSNNDPLGTYVDNTIFIRILTIEYIDNEGNIIDSMAGYTSDINRMRVTSTVSWLSGTHWFKVELITHLTDYLGREQLSS